MLELSGFVETVRSFFVNILLSAFDQRFAEIDRSSLELLSLLTEETLFKRPRETRQQMAPFSCGEYILRSAAMVEKTFGGITTRLWDDPFEWTLPEKLSTKELVTNYLNEVQATRKNAFAFFSSDDDLMRQIPAPEKLRPIFEILLDTVARAEHFQGRAYALYQVISQI